MEDSGVIPEIIPEVVSEEPKKEITTALIRTKHGTMAEASRGSRGRFVKKLDRREVSESQAKVIGRRLFKEKDLWLKILLKQAELAQSIEDPKMASASTKAAEFCRAFLYGKLSLSDEDKAAREHDGIKVVVFTQPQVEEGVDHTKIEKPVKPSWIDAEVVSTNEPPKQE